MKNKQIKYVGCRDHQVKIRGQGVELDEMKQIIRCSHANILHYLVH